MRDTVVSGGSPSWKYWNKFEATSKVIGSTITLDSEFGPGSLGWRIDVVNGTTMPPKETTTTTNAPGVPSIGTTNNGRLSYYNYIYKCSGDSVFQGENHPYRLQVQCCAQDRQARLCLSACFFFDYYSINEGSKWKTLK